jgi:hypothetical protein
MPNDKWVYVCTQWVAIAIIAVGCFMMGRQSLRPTLREAIAVIEKAEAHLAQLQRQSHPASVPQPHVFTPAPETLLQLENQHLPIIESEWGPWPSLWLTDPTAIPDLEIIPFD